MSPLKLTRSAGITLMVFGLARLAMGWFGARAGELDLYAMAAIVTVSLKIFTVGLVLVIIAVVWAAIARSRARAVTRGTQA